MSIFSTCLKLVAPVAVVAAALAAAEEANQQLLLQQHQPCSESGRCAAAADAVTGTKAGDLPVSLLQLKAAGAEAAAAASPSSSSADDGGGAVARRAAAAAEAEGAASARGQSMPSAHRRSNMTFGRVFGKKDACEKTVGSCLFSACDASKAAQCHSGFCTCPDFMCNDGTGKCMLSATEIVGALEHGISQSSINEQVTALANSLPGVADSISSVTDILSGVANSVGTVIGAVTGLYNGCSKMVSTCIWSDCPESVGMAATCDYGVCSCKENFCYNWVAEKAYCVVDLEKLMGGGSQ